MWVSKMRVFCVVAYKGTRYSGWEKQTDELTIQGEIEKNISQIFNKDITIYASGRTDAGVHALGQTFHFDVDEVKYDENDLMYHLNVMLPADIQILSLKYLPEGSDFHARFSATSKVYQYRIGLNSKNPFRYDRAWMLKSKDFDEELFKAALSKFVGVHNFKNFTSKEDDKDNYIREIYEINCDFDRENEEYVITLTGNGFMRYQIRFMLGSAVAIANKKEELSYIDNLLDSDKKRSICSYKGHPQGLYLVKVNYK